MNVCERNYWFFGVLNEMYVDLKFNEKMSRFVFILFYILFVEKYFKMYYIFIVIFISIGEIFGIKKDK